MSLQPPLWLNMKMDPATLALGKTKDEGIPFLVVSAFLPADTEYSAVSYASAYEGEEHIITIELLTVQPLDIKFLPEEVLTSVETAQTTADVAQATADVARNLLSLGMTWTQSNITSGSYYNNIFYNNDLWVATSSNTGIYYSIDGMTWTKSNADSYAYVDSLRVLGGVWFTDFFVTSGTDGYISWASKDGKTWTKSNVRCLAPQAYINGVWIAKLSGGSNLPSGLYYSTDGMTWVNAVGPTSTYYSSVVFVNNVGITISSDSGIWCTTSLAAMKDDLNAHDKSNFAHEDIRHLISTLTKRIDELETLLKSTAAASTDQ